MKPSKSDSSKHFALAACAAVVAAAVTGVPEEARAIDQIERYCVASWKNARINRQDWPDCTQETISELMQRVQLDGMVHAITHVESAERRELNRSVWTVIQRWRRTRRLAPLDHEVCVAGSQHPVDCAGSELAELLEQHAHVLTDRQRAVINRLRDGESVAEIAESLNMSPAMVSDVKYRAIRRLRVAIPTAEC